MQDLQELFESMGTDTFNKLAELLDKKNLNPKNAEWVLDMISIVYCSEMGVAEANLTNQEMDKVINDFYISVGLYSGVLEGKMEIYEGRIRLTNGDDCKFRLTPAGIEHAEKLIKELTAK